VEVQELVAGPGASSVELVSDSLQGFGLSIGPTPVCRETFSYEAKKVEVAIHLADLLASRVI